MSTTTISILIVLVIITIAGLLAVSLSVAIIRPTQRGLIEKFGKYRRFCNPGLVIRIPIVERLVKVNVTEMMVDAGSQEIITKDKLNATVDAQVYFRVCDTEDSVKASQYNVNNYKNQIINLARTTLRNIIGTMNLVEANTERGRINKDLFDTLNRETSSWGISMVRTELKEINPPKDVQETMNKVVKAENEKTAAIDFATAAETQADGKRRAAIKEADGIKQSRVLTAEGEAAAIKLVNEAANTYFVGNAVHLKSLQVVEGSLKNATKIVVPANQPIVNIIGQLSGIDTPPKA
jgi:regulator of protease activity HflC (stomatin/prohibitin superfamily)